MLLFPVTMKISVGPNWPVLKGLSKANPSRKGIH